MSYVSLFKNIPDLLSQPIGIAAIASLGIHGAIAMIVPLMPMDSSKPKDTASSKTVGLLELSQADQNRLPQTTPQTGLQQLPPIAPLSTPNFSAQSGLPPLTAPPSTSQLVLPPLPPSSNNYQVSSLPTRQSLRMIPSDNLRFDASKFDNSKYNNNAKFSPVPRVNVSDTKYEPSKPLDVNRLPELQPEKINGDMLQNAQSQPLSDTNSIRTAQTNITPQMMQSGNDASRFSPNPLINSLKQASRGGDTLIGTRGTTLQTPNLSGKGTELATAQLDSYANLRKEVQQKYPNAEQKPVIRETLPTNKPNLEGAVLGVLVVDPDGKVLDIKFQNKLLSPELQLKARQYFNKQSPKGDKQISSYPFNLSFQNSTSNTTGTNQLSAPGINNNQLTPLPADTSKPFPELRIRKNQPTPSSTGTLQPLASPGVNGNQSQFSPTATPKPLSELPIINQQSTPSSEITTSETLLLPRVNKSQPTTSTESNEKLVKLLREVKEDREKSNLDQ
ncbi:hypothetical protein GTQ43_28865 [Nostoc sp. KVJ3]|uniref:hypothetical protein n=1 Tax=Nostoc sp. KVJ3 TaxID=457945 RepID=UPI00223900F4|nr:hypothetical protein [Nostoc sp. KVJ3]MCW5317642.1 hypothetical protein [Nostoc sp. KVJ3]